MFGVNVSQQWIHIRALLKALDLIFPETSCISMPVELHSTMAFIRLTSDLSWKKIRSALWYCSSEIMSDSPAQILVLEQYLCWRNYFKTGLLSCELLMKQFLILI